MAEFVSNNIIISSGEKPFVDKDLHSKHIDGGKKGCRSSLSSCFFGCSIIILILLITISLIFFFTFDGYNRWLLENEDFLYSVTSAYEDIEENDSDLERKLDRFQDSLVEKETLTIDCFEVNTLIKSIISQHWDESNIQRVGVVCSERRLDIYIQLDNGLWFIVRIWQRAEGKMELVVYDVMLGPYSLGGLTWGYITKELNAGLDDGITFVVNSQLMGRSLVEFYVEEGKLRIVGKIE